MSNLLYSNRKCVWWSERGDTGSAIIPDLIGNLVNLLKYLVVSIFFPPLL